MAAGTLASSATAHAAEGFTPADPLSSVRSNGEAVPLDDGRVLVIGGRTQGGGPSAAAEIYDPATRSFTPTQSMGVARTDFTATMLDNGLVLVAGGFTNTGATVSTELYNPSSGQWFAGLSLQQPRGFAAATKLADGRVLISGGIGSGVFQTASSEIYDFDGGATYETGALNHARTFHTTTLLPDGRVVAIGGSDTGVDVPNNETYDPATGLWTDPLKPMAIPRNFHTATPLADGSVLVAGGVSAGSATASIELYSPVNGQSFPLTAMTSARAGHTATQLSDGRVLFMGGSDGAANVASAEVYNPTTFGVTAVGPMSSVRSNAMAAPLAGGSALVVGGSTTGNNVTASADTFGPVDAPPSAVDDSATVGEDSGANTIDVLDNDTDTDGGPMTIADETDGVNGAVEITNSGADLTYEPAADFCGSDSFTYTLNGGSTATVSVTVSCVEDAADAVDDSATVDEDSGANSINVRANDTDVDGDPDLVTAKTNGAHGTVEITNGGDDLTYTPNPDYCGADSFDYTLAGGDTATVSVTVGCVEDDPVAADDSVDLDEDAAPTALSLRDNDTDVDGGTKTITDVLQPAHGEVVIVNGGNDVTYEPFADFCGDDAFIYSLNNGASSATVSVTVNCVEDPADAVDDVATVDEDSGENTIDVRVNDTDGDPVKDSVTATTNGLHGIVAITNGGDEVGYTPDAQYCGPDSFDYTLAGGDTATVSVDVTCLEDAAIAVDDTATVEEDADPSRIDVRANDTDADETKDLITSASDGGTGTVAVTNGGADLTYTPAEDYCGFDVFGYQLAGGDSATVVVEITCVDDAPTAADDTASVDEDSGANAIDVLDNDLDVDEGPKQVIDKTNGAHGTVAITNEGNDVSYSPAANYCGADSFTYEITGGSEATVSVDVNCLEDAADAVDDTVSVDEDSGANAIDVRDNDTDPDQTKDLITSFTEASHGDVALTNGGDDVGYTPDGDYCGADEFTYRLEGGDTATVAVTVDCVEDATDAIDDGASVDEDSGANTIDLRANDTDVDPGGGKDAIVAKTNGTHGTVAITSGGADLTYTPDDDFCGFDDFTYELAGGDSAAVNVQVACEDDPADAVDDTLAIDEDDAATTLDVRTNDTDVDGPVDAVDAKTNGAHGTVAITNSGADLTYAPDADYCGADSFTYTLEGGDTATVSVAIDCVEDAADAVDDDATVDEDSGANTIAVRANDVDPDATKDLVAAKTDPAHGTVAINGDQTAVVYTPASQYCGPDSFEYTVAGGDSATASVTVTCVDDAPSAVDDAQTLDEDTPTMIDVRANDTDIDAGPKQVTQAANGAHGSVAIHAGDDVSYTPTPDYCGADSFTYGLNGGSSASVSVTVTCVADATKAVGDSATVAEDAGPTTIDVRANDTDPDSPREAITAETGGAHGDVAITHAGDDLSYAPNADYCGADSFTYTLSGGDPATVSVSVTCVDDNPVAVDDSTTLNANSGATTIDVRANDTDVDDGPKLIGAASNGAHGAVAVANDGSDLAYTPNPDYCSADSFTYTLNGGSTATVAVTVICGTQPSPDSGTALGGAEPQVEGRILTLELVCESTSTCAGTAEVSDRVPKDILDKTRAALAHGKYAIAPGATSKLKLRLTKAGKRFLVGRERLRGRLTLVSSNGATDLLPVTFTVRHP